MALEENKNGCASLGKTSYVQVIFDTRGMFIRRLKKTPYCHYIAYTSKHIRPNTFFFVIVLKYIRVCVSVRNNDKLSLIHIFNLIFG